MQLSLAYSDHWTVFSGIKPISKGEGREDCGPSKTILGDSVSWSRPTSL